MSGIMYHLSFCDELNLLIKMSSWFIYVVACVGISFFIFMLNNILLSEWTTFCLSIIH